MPLERFAEASFKELLYAVSMVENCVTRVGQQLSKQLLWYREKGNVLKSIFLQTFTFF